MKVEVSGLVDQFGHALPKGGKARAGALISGSRTPYDAASRTGAEFEGWYPWSAGADGEMQWGQRDTVVSRVRDMVRNDATASGIIDRITDATIGGDFRVSAMPDFAALAHFSGNAAFDATWAREFQVAAEAGFRSWAYDPNKFCDVEKRLSFPMMARLAFRNFLVEGESFAAMPWRPDRIGYGKARFATTLQMIDPDRLSNPANAMDRMRMRGGIELGEDGEVLAYHVREAHMGDWWAAAQSLTWDRIPAETEFGRKMVLHFFNPARPGQHRPIGGILVPVLGKLKMMAQYARVELQAAVVNSLFGAYVTSPYDQKDVQDALDDEEGRELSQYQQMRSEFHEHRKLLVGDVRMPTLFPGESINVVDSKRPNTGFDAFVSAMLRSVATALGVAYETLSSDYRGSTYSSARQASNEAWLTLTRRRAEFGQNFCGPIYANVLEEMFDRGDLPLPSGGVPDFAEMRGSYARAHWFGPGRGYVDPSKEAEAARMRIASGLSTLQEEVAQLSGRDYETVLGQLKIEQDIIKRDGLNIIFDPTAAQAGVVGNDASDGGDANSTGGDGKGDAA
jgi:lambda family phage portal protein